jgi:hypothetical protein
MQSACDAVATRDVRSTSTPVVYVEKIAAAAPLTLSTAAAIGTRKERFPSLSLVEGRLSSDALVGSGRPGRLLFS